eukprot:1452106-Rhodomonas_salina.2
MRAAAFVRSVRAQHTLRQYRTSRSTRVGPWKKSAISLPDVASNARRQTLPYAISLPNIASHVRRTIGPHLEFCLVAIGLSPPYAMSVPDIA